MVVTKDSQDADDAKRAVAMLINLPRRSLRTIGPLVVDGVPCRCRFVGRVGVSGRSCAFLAASDSGGFGFGGLAGSSE